MAQIAVIASRLQAVLSLAAQISQLWVSLGARSYSKNGIRCSKIMLPNAETEHPHHWRVPVMSALLPISARARSAVGDQISEK
jgi:hypothetical protein